MNFSRKNNVALHEIGHTLAAYHNPFFGKFEHATIKAVDGEYAGRVNARFLICNTQSCFWYLLTYYVAGMVAELLENEDIAEENICWEYLNSTFDKQTFTDIQLAISSLTRIFEVLAKEDSLWGFIDDSDFEPTPPWTRAPKDPRSHKIIEGINKTLAIENRKPLGPREVVVLLEAINYTFSLFKENEKIIFQGRDKLAYFNKLNHEDLVSLFQEKSFWRRTWRELSNLLYTTKEYWKSILVTIQLHFIILIESL